MASLPRRISYAMSLTVVILAAGKGTRMKSSMPKVLHAIGDKPLVGHVISTAQSLGAEKICVVVGHGAEQVQAKIDADVHWVMQLEQKGTGHAVQQAMPEIDSSDTVLILYGDVPLTREQTLRDLLAVTNENTIGLLTVTLDDPSGYGRIVREGGEVMGIVEEKDASDEQKAICETNTGILAIRGDHLGRLLAGLSNNNAQGEYYLTDIFSRARERGIGIATVDAAAEWEVAGVNSRRQLAELERTLQANIAGELMDAGVTLKDPARIDVRGNLKVGTDVTIDVNCVFEGDCEIGDGAVIGPNCVFKNTRIGAGTLVRANCVLEDASVGDDCTVGPFARLRPKAVLADDAHVGNFVEVKNSNIGEGSKVNHLAYVGDADIGRSVNVGAGTITCNYDGANKHRTVMEDDVFIGSNSSLVAPVRIAAGATVGAGSTISRDVEAGALALTRAPQKSLKDWARPSKNK
jgi:bifunctional UDP-N-acetylglucosamine pyrophosphorylase/glucosamine-1-phosphate N-acetyltransferase